MHLQHALENVLDLTDPRIRKLLGTDRPELRAPWRLSAAKGVPIATQTLGQAAFDCGLFEAIYFESAVLARHYNFAIFPDRLQAPSRIRVYNPGGILSESLP